MVVSPKFDPPLLPDLVAGDESVLEPRAVVEATFFESQTWSDRDLTDLVLSESRLDGVSIADCVLRGIRVSECLIDALNAPVLAAGRSQWRDTSIQRSRIGSAELFDADLSMVRIENSKIGYLNLRSAVLNSVIITGCTIDELDLGGVRAKRVAIVDCQLGTLDVTRAQLTDVDLRGSSLTSIVGIDGLRGATVDNDQLSALAEHLASAAGILVE
ncbi:MAG: pentapeptide repeat-containing protein [Rhodoglobus sp.]